MERYITAAFADHRHVIVVTHVPPFVEACWYQGQATLNEWTPHFSCKAVGDRLLKIADHHPDVIFVDIMMPRLDGYQTCSLIKHNASFRDTPVIMLSSKDGLFDRARGRIVGSEQYLTKPFTRDELLSAIAQQVERHQASAE